MSNTNGLFTDGSDPYAPRANSIPLTDSDAYTAENGSIGDLVSDATAQMSSLVRAEVELAKAEIATEVKKGVWGGGLFGVAGIIALYSSFFFFFFVAEVLNIWLQRWAAFLIVFIIMLVLAGLFALFGWRKVKKIVMPKETIESVTELRQLIPGKGSKAIDAPDGGMYS